MTLTVCHLIDDAGFGGINRMLDHMVQDPVLAELAQHRIVRVKRGQLTPPALNADVIVSHLSICWKNMPFLTALRALNPRTPLLHVEHSYSERFVAANVVNRDRFDTLMKVAYAMFDEIIAVSEAQGRWLRRRFVGAGRLAVIPSCVSLERFFKVEPASPRSTRTIGAIGRFDVQKGFDILIEGFKASGREDLELHLYGDGPQRRQLEAMAEGRPEIVICSYVQYPSIAMAGCDVIAMPSRWEPYGLVALEAMAASRPVVCSDADGLSDHIHAGAVCVGENSVDGWARWFASADIAGLEIGNEKRRARAGDAVVRFAGAWTDLLLRATGLSPLPKLAA